MIRPHGVTLTYHLLLLISTSASSFEVSRYNTESQGRDTIRLLHPTDDMSSMRPESTPDSMTKVPVLSVSVDATDMESASNNLTVANSIGIESTEESTRAFTIRE